MPLISKEQCSFEKTQIAERFRNVIGANAVFHKSDKRKKTAKKIKIEWDIDFGVFLSSDNYISWIKEFDYNYLGFLSEIFVLGIMEKSDFEELWKMLDAFDASFILFGISSAHQNSNGNLVTNRQFSGEHLKSMGEYLARRNKTKKEQELASPLPDILSESELPF